VGGTDFLAQAFSLAYVDHMGSANTAKALRQHNIGTTVNHAEGLEGSSICGHGALDKIVTNLSHANIQLLADGTLVNTGIDNLYIWTLMPYATHINPLFILCF
jgi:hypothetical protein